MKWIIGIIAGVAIGFGYWYFIGCNTGACAIASSPINSTIYGGLMGILLVNSFSRNRKEKEESKSCLRPSLRK